MTSEILPLERIAVRVETEEESRAVQERFFALGKKWRASGVNIRPLSDMLQPEIGVAYYDAEDGMSTGGFSSMGRTVLPASVFLRDYPAPGAEPKYPYLKDWKPGERVSVLGSAATILEPDAKTDNRNAIGAEFWRCVAMNNHVPYRLDVALNGTYCFGDCPSNLTRLTNSGNGTWTHSSGGAVAVDAAPAFVPLKIAEPEPDPCPRCGVDMNKAGSISSRKDFTAIACLACVESLLIKEGWVKPERKQTRAEALEDLAKGSRWTHPRLPWFGDRR